MGRCTLRRAALLVAISGLLGGTAPALADGMDVVEQLTGGGDIFEFVKLDDAGEPLENQGAIYTITSWSCVRDDVTGLMWEIKTTDGGLHDQGHTYTWYDPDPETNGGAPGTEDGGECGGGVACDTHAYVAAVNERGLCGHADWRLPTRAELRTIVDYRAEFPAIDTDYFANTIARSFWTAEANETYPNFAWHTDFKFGLASYYYKKSGPKSVRLVRGGK